MTTKPDERRQARKTTVMVGLVLLACAFWTLYRHHPLRAQIFSGLGAYLVLLGLLAPRWAIPFHHAWMKLAAALGYINSRILLSILYYGLFTPLGLVLRLARRDPLNRRRKGSDSYWIPRRRVRQSREEFERLF